MAYVIIALIAYLIGSISNSVIISKKKAGFDVREKGSGNAGTTNVLRTVGKGAAALTLVLDILKGVIAIGIAFVVGKIFSNVDRAALVQIAALFVVIGHTYPVFFGFKGGKGVATSVGILLMINWKIGLICVIYGVCVIAVTRMVSLGSILSAVLFAILTIFIRDCYLVPYSSSYIIFSIILAAIVIFNHRSNLKRINAGVENRISFSKKEEKKEDEDKTEEEVKVEEPIEIKVDNKEDNTENK